MPRVWAMLLAGQSHLSDGIRGAHPQCALGAGRGVLFGQRAEELLLKGDAAHDNFGPRRAQNVSQLSLHEMRVDVHDKSAKQRRCEVKLNHLVAVGQKNPNAITMAHAHLRKHASSLGRGGVQLLVCHRSVATVHDGDVVRVRRPCVLKDARSSGGNSGDRSCARRLRAPNHTQRVIAARKTQNARWRTARNLENGLVSIQLSEQLQCLHQRCCDSGYGGAAETGGVIHQIALDAAIRVVNEPQPHLKRRLRERQHLGRGRLRVRRACLVKGRDVAEVGAEQRVAGAAVPRRVHRLDHIQQRHGGVRERAQHRRLHRPHKVAQRRVFRQRAVHGQHRGEAAYGVAELRVPLERRAQVQRNAHGELALLAAGALVQLQRPRRQQQRERGHLA